MICKILCLVCSAKLMGYKRSPPPFFSLGGLANYSLRRPSFRGLNFASAGSGLLDPTGSTLVSWLCEFHCIDCVYVLFFKHRVSTFPFRQGVVPLSEQIKQFAAVQKNLTAIRGSAAAEAFLCKSLFFLSIGSNDFFSYFASNSTMSPLPPPAEFLSILIKAYDKSIRVRPYYCNLKSISRTICTFLTDAIFFFFFFCDDDKQW